MKNVQRWIKTQKELLSVARSDIRRKVKGAEGLVLHHMRDTSETYKGI